MVENDVFGRCVYSVKNRTRSSVADMNESSIDGKHEDDDVAEEKKRINSNSITHLMETESIIIKNLTKFYDNFRAVNKISIGIAPNECFGLLGQNGAGKTTTFKMLTGDVPVTKGNAFLNKYDIKQHMRQVQQNLGYCPQFDALIDEMTGRETLRMYARLRGVQENQIDGVVNDVMDVMMLKKYADRQVGTYRYIKGVGLGYGRQLCFHCLLKYMVICAFENSPSIPSFLATQIVYIRYG
jgi:ATP-binding cassette subfamily A (ABC1) protein 3